VSDPSAAPGPAAAGACVKDEDQDAASGCDARESVLSTAELLGDICCRLEARSLLACGSVCRAWRDEVPLPLAWSASAVAVWMLQKDAELIELTQAMRCAPDRSNAAPEHHHPCRVDAHVP
jgi:hypothetical protein